MNAFPIAMLVNILMTIMWAYEIGGLPLAGLLLNSLATLIIFIAWTKQ